MWRDIKSVAVISLVVRIWRLSAHFPGIRVPFALYRQVALGLGLCFGGTLLFLVMGTIFLGVFLGGNFFGGFFSNSVVA